MQLIICIIYGYVKFLMHQYDYLIFASRLINFCDFGIRMWVVRQLDLKIKELYFR
jgi:hypothetical protein